MDLLRKKIRKEAKRNNLDIDELADAVHGTQYLKSGNEAEGMYYLKGKSDKTLEVAENIVQFMSDLEEQPWI